MNPLQQELRQVSKQCLKPRPLINIREWADEYRRLSREASAEPGRWRTSRTPYMAEPLETISNDEVREVVLMLSSQLGKSELLLNVIGFYAHLEPSPVLVIQPTEFAAASFSKERIAPMIRDTEVITELFKNDAYGDSANTILHKSFPGGFVALAGSNSPTALAGRPIRIILLDEVDRFPASAKTEGDPVDIVRRRSQNFPDSKFIAVSTPTITGSSKIAQLYANSDQRKWHIQCIHCDEYFYPEWKHVSWTDPEDALLFCPHCGAGLNDNERLVSSTKGIWVASNPGHHIPGFHTNALVSPWVKMVNLVREFVLTENKPERLQPFYNTVLGLDYEYVGESISDLAVAQRVESYTTTTIPNEVFVLTAGVDVQGDRFEWEVLGHTENGSTFNIDYKIYPCDTKDESSYEELKNQLLNTKYVRHDGVELQVFLTLIDSGYNTKQVYKFVGINKKNRIYAVKGVAGPKAMIVESKSKYGNANFYKVGVDIFKEMLFNQLQITDPSKPGYCHFPEDRSQEYFVQLCQSETRTWNIDKHGKGYWHFEKRDANTRNEPLDCRVYALAAFDILKKVGVRNAQYSVKKQLEKSSKQAEKPLKVEENAIEPTEIVDIKANVEQKTEVPINTNTKTGKYSSWKQTVHKPQW